MNTPVREGLGTLTEKEKQTLRLIVSGHDAKSIARSLGLSVHTINERLRDARRKMAVSSSRQAARMLLEVEGAGRGVNRSGAVALPDPHLFVDAEIGGDACPPRMDQETAPIDGVGWAYRHPRIIIGVFLMTLALGLLALVASPQTASTTQPTPISAPSPVADAPTPAATSREAPNPEVVETARQWLALVDQSRWDESYQATGTAFRKLNTAQIWASASERVRVPLGAMISRTFVSQENLPAPPDGYEVVKFRTVFANKADAVETVSLDREGDKWRVVGVTIG